jgi:hypothetical protein
MLRTIHRQIEYLRADPETRFRVIGRLEALYRLARINAQAGATTRLGQLSLTLQQALPGQIALLKGDSNNDRKVVEALTRIGLGASLLIRCPYEDRVDRKADKPKEIVEKLALADEDGMQDAEHELTRTIFGI